MPRLGTLHSPTCNKQFVSQHGLQHQIDRWRPKSSKQNTHYSTVWAGTSARGQHSNAMWDRHTGVAVQARASS